MRDETKKTGEKTMDSWTEDITVEANEILKPAMRNFCKPQQSTMSDREVYIQKRAAYWYFNQNKSKGEAFELAVKDYEWVS